MLWQELVACSQFGLEDSPALSLLLGEGDGNFQNAVKYAAGTNPIFVAVMSLLTDRLKSSSRREEALTRFGI